MKTMIPKWEDEVNEEDNAGDDGDHAKSHSSLSHEQKSTFGGSLKGKSGKKKLSAQSFYLALTKKSFNRQF